jgi:hypothetical protein
MHSLLLTVNTINKPNYNLEKQISTNLAYIVYDFVGKRGKAVGMVGPAY